MVNIILFQKLCMGLLVDVTVDMLIAEVFDLLILLENDCPTVKTLDHKHSCRKAIIFCCRGGLKCLYSFLNFAMGYFRKVPIHHREVDNRIPITDKSRVFRPFLVGRRNTEYFHIPTQHIPCRPPSGGLSQESTVTLDFFFLERHDVSHLPSFTERNTQALRQH